MLLCSEIIHREGFVLHAQASDQSCNCVQILKLDQRMLLVYPSAGAERQRVVGCGDTDRATLYSFVTVLCFLADCARNNILLRS